MKQGASTVSTLGTWNQRLPGRCNALSWMGWFSWAGWGALFAVFSISFCDVILQCPGKKYTCPLQNVGNSLWVFDDGWNDWNKLVSVAPAQYIAVQLCRGTGRILGNSIVTLCRQMSQTDVAMARTWCGTLVTTCHYFSGAQLPQAVSAGTGTLGRSADRFEVATLITFSWLMNWKGAQMRPEYPKLSQRGNAIFSPFACGNNRRRMKFGPLIS